MRTRSGAGRPRPPERQARLVAVRARARRVRADVPRRARLPRTRLTPRRPSWTASSSPSRIRATACRSRSRISSTRRACARRTARRLRGARADRDGRGRAAARGGGLREQRQDEPARVRLRGHLAERPLRHGAEPARARPHRGRVERRLGGGDRRGARDVGLGTDSGGSIRIPAACWDRRVQADARPRADGRRLPARAELRPRGAAGARRRRLRRADEGARAGSPRAGRRRRPRGRGCVARGGGRGGARRAPKLALFPEWRGLPFPEPVGTVPAFMRDVAGVHRELFEEHAELYGANPRRRSSAASR